MRLGEKGLRVKGVKEGASYFLLVFADLSLKGPIDRTDIQLFEDGRVPVVNVITDRWEPLVGRGTHSWRPLRHDRPQNRPQIGPKQAQTQFVN